MSEAIKIKLSKKDLESDQDVRWCPGCGDYAILATVQRTLAQLGIRRENTVFVSGIGCSSRFPYYMNTYGFHTIHGRAPAIASGLKVTRPDLDVWVITGDGDGLSIGGNHMIHALRRNMDLKILLFNNQIYGLTKGQYSPTSSLGTRAPSTPTGSIDHPLNPISLALGAGATFVARAADTDAKLMGKILEEAYKHKGAVFIELLQNCPVFNDGVWEAVKDDPTNRQIVLAEGKPLVFANGTKGIKLGPGLVPEIVDIVDGDTSQLLVHQERGSLLYANALAQLVQPQFPMPVGVLYRHDKPTYEQLALGQVQEAIEKQGPGDLEKLLYSGMTWEVGSDGRGTDMTAYLVTTDAVDKTIASFTRLDQRGDKRAMNKLAQRLQKEQPFLLQFAAAVRGEHGDTVGEAAVFYATLVWAMFDRGDDATLPRLTQKNLTDADAVVSEALSKVEGIADKPPYERVAPALVATQPHIYAKLSELLAEDVKEKAMTPETAATIIKPTEVVIEAFDAALSGRRPGERQGTVVAADKVGRNEPCPCGSGKKFKKCHGDEAARST